MEWSTHQVVEATGMTSRTLRHYDQIGLLKPTRLGAGRLRYYDQRALIRLQRILLLRELVLPLEDIADPLGRNHHCGAAEWKDDHAPEYV